MTKITFKNLPDTSTPLNASNLNTLQDNVENAINTVAGDIPTIDSSVSTSSTNGVENQAITNYVDSEISDTKDYADNASLDVYSTTEIRIGTWTNGKPLYRKVFTGTTVDGDLSIDMSSLNIAILTNCYGRSGASGTFRPLNFYYAGYSLNTRYASGTMYLFASTPYAGESFEMVVEYTKN